MKTIDISINEAKRLYIIPCGSGYTCHGFDVVERLCVHLARELAARGHNIPTPAISGTMERYEQYQDFCEVARDDNARTGWRSTAELTPALVGMEGRRVKVVTEWGETVRFQVGKSTGWMPCHLMIARRNSSGGPAVCIGIPKSVRIIS